ncbi:hypothetical protein U1Q18_051734 [Sarracenia purpurea var. burkii]
MHSRRDLFPDDYDEYETDSEYELERWRAEYEEYEQNKSSPIFVNRNNEYDKLKKFQKNGDFSDITVRVEENAYQLHRAVFRIEIRLFSRYFSGRVC